MCKSTNRPENMGAAMYKQKAPNSTQYQHMYMWRSGVDSWNRKLCAWVRNPKVTINLIFFVVFDVPTSDLIKLYRLPYCYSI